MNYSAYSYTIPSPSYPSLSHFILKLDRWERMFLRWTFGWLRPETLLWPMIRHSTEQLTVMRCVSELFGNDLPDSIWLFCNIVSKNTRQKNYIRITFNIMISYFNTNYMCTYIKWCTIIRPLLSHHKLRNQVYCPIHFLFYHPGCFTHDNPRYSGCGRWI